LDAEAGQSRRDVAALKLAYVVITSVDRDDLRDSGAQRFVDCIRAVRNARRRRGSGAGARLSGGSSALDVWRRRPT
jgi:hypothetical protein